ncbi:hypothetical protein QM480_06575 [Flectobacillus sp. DC10W]|uniref:Uncharacterized protein n=1 Tax=Flectobacillus longus TaxID=2984207 RepID=A0ABT6YKA8_9BACT|nr:hypothetical protein [Flectobacillus longus]MDI9863980.1 hypothetical protein [Flectobacillus longus]
MFLIFLICIAVVFLIVVVGGASSKHQTDKLQAEIKKLSDLGIHFSRQSHVSNSLFIALDHLTKKLVIIQLINGSAFTTILNFDEIYDCEVSKNGTMIYKKSATRTIGGALIGGALSGGVGAIVGGLSGASKAQEKIDKIELKIITKDITKNSVWITFYDSKKDLGMMQETMLREAETWKDTVSLIIDMNS